MRCQRVAWLSAIIVLFSIVVCSSGSVQANWRWSPDVEFGLPAYNATVRFDDWIELSNFTWNEANASEIVFQALEKPSYILNKPYNLTLNYNVTDSSLLVNSTGLQDRNCVVGTETLMLNMRYEAVKNGSITAQDQNDALRRLYATISNITGKAQVQIYTNGYRPRYVKVGGSYLPSSEWSYDADTKILTFNVTAASPRNVEPIFGPTDEDITTGTVLSGLMAFLGSARKKISGRIQKHQKLIERGVIAAIIVVVVTVAIWFLGIYAGMW